MWKAIRRGFNKGWDESNRKFEAEHGHKPEETISRGWERGKQAAADGQGIRAAMGRDQGNEQKGNTDAEI